ncbi:hypothetical protein [Enterocloster clostridioformis]|nr:hypothetical protein [Enterocloster clostridioformis]
MNFHPHIHALFWEAGWMQEITGKAAGGLLPSGQGGLPAVPRKISC